MNEIPQEEWLFEIKPKSSVFTLQLDEVWRYRDLLFLFVKRNVVTLYKQTILGPLWYLIQPLFTTLTFTLIFNKVAGISTGSVPPFLFNMAGVITWNYFTACLTDTSDTFKANASLFGKVYFPRLIMPLATVITNLIKLGIQCLLFLGFYLYFYWQGMSNTFSIYTLFFPFLVLIMGVLGLALGMIISSMVTKYRDLTFLVGFGVQLLMYLSAVMYPIALIEEKMPQLAYWVQYNPLAYIIETARFLLLQEGTVSPLGLLYTVAVTLILFLFGLVLFNRTERSFIDTV
ncbi:ABC transporter permease [Flavobacterium agrisoli]|uniref:Transport permease protein n=1 Tax=Flavobacterium agrisoli TaxID=2793066 RepID=A0A934UKR8_9FLAO|nr:ABC transporter permease [Flavobacterium agrisoli]MBK0371252.1 ABC transporter permease [Flavobacterium agrisoli]